MLFTLFQYQVVIFPEQTILSPEYLINYDTLYVFYEST